MSNTREDIAKFRAWEVKSGIMLDWLTICQTAFNDNRSFYNLLYRVMTDPDSQYIKMQSTGFRDAAGTAIYLNDILEYDRFHELDAEQITELPQAERYTTFEVVKVSNGWWINSIADFGYSWGCCCYSGTFQDYFSEHFFEGSNLFSKSKIIGNRYENPELLKP